MNNLNKARLTTNRFILRPLDVSDATPRYLSWLVGDEANFILTANETKSLLDLEGYICDKVDDPNVLFLGIFLNENNQHIGNIKFEPVNPHLKFATLGIFIGELEFRGKGVATEVIQASAIWLREHIDIQEIFLGVEAKNSAAINAYKKCGFETTETFHIPAGSHIIKMRLDTMSL